METKKIARDRILNARDLVTLYTWIAAHEHDPEWADACFLVRFVLGTGLRVSEVPPIVIERDCEPHGVVHIRNGKGGKYRLARCIPELQPHYERRIREIGRGLLFPRGDARIDPQTPYSTRTFQAWWGGVMRASGVNPISIHGGRHTYAVAEMHRLRDFEVRDLLGHSKLTITHGYYTHVDVDGLYQDGEPEWRTVALGGQPKAERKLSVVK
jgi:integrase